MASSSSLCSLEWGATDRFVQHGRFSGAVSRDDEDSDEQLESCTELLCKWLQMSNFLSKDHPAYTARVNVYCLTNAAFIAEVVRCLCPVAHATQLNLMGDATPAVDVAASCLRAVFKAVHSVDINMDKMISSTLRAGEADFEPLQDIVLLWRHILTYAVCCEAREQHIDTIRHMPADFQNELMQVITNVEQHLNRRKNNIKRESSVARTPKLSCASTTSRAGDSDINPALLTPCSRHMCTIGVDKDHEHGKEIIETLLKENSQLRLRTRQLSEQVEKDRNVRQRSTVVLDGEFESFEKSWNLEKQLAEKDALIHVLEQQVHGGRQAIDELGKLNDELQLARTREAEHAALKARLERCSQRLEEAGNLKLELQACMEKHAAVCRERDAVIQEVGQLKGTSQQLDAWKTKVRNLELQCSDADVRVRTAEAHAQSAKSELQRLVGEKDILEDKLQESELQVAVLREGGSGVCANGEIQEPFTAELKERMHHLESRNALLEQQISIEGSERLAELVVEIENLRGLKDHFEQLYRDTANKLEKTECRLVEATDNQAILEVELQNHKRQFQVTDSRLIEEQQRAEIAEMQLAEVFQKWIACDEELVQQKLLGSDLEEKLKRTSNELHISKQHEVEISELLKQGQQQMAEDQNLLEQQKTDLKAACDSIMSFQKELDSLRVALVQAEEANEESRMELETQFYQLEEARRQCSFLQSEKAEAASVRHERDKLLDVNGEMTKTQEQLKSELLACKEQMFRNEKRLEEMETRQKKCEGENEDLRTQLKHSLCEKNLHERRRAGLLESEETWAQKQAELQAKLDDLQQGLAAEITYNSDLYEQAKDAERKSQQLEDLVNQFAPEELRTAASNITCNRSFPGAQSEVTQLRAENRRLHAALSEQRLRVAGDSKQLAMTSAKLRHLEKVAEQGKGTEVPMAITHEVSPGDVRAGAIEGCTPQSVAPSPPNRRITGQVVAPASTATVDMPRPSILKKPKSSGGDTSGKENCPPSVYNSKKPCNLTQDKSGGASTRRIGLIGGIGTSVF